MGASMFTLIGAAFALAVVAGAWCLARRRAARSTGVPPASDASVGARVGASRVTLPPGMPGDDDEPDDGFDYAPELRLPLAASGGGEAFQQTLEWQQLRRDLEALQRKFDEHHRVIEALQAEIEGLREQLAGGSRPRAASPEYDAALAYARQGLGAAEIAERSGITLAAAELVRAMAAQSTITREGATP